MLLSVLSASAVAGQMCSSSIDLLFLVDTTGSLMDDMRNLIEQFDPVVETANQLFPEVHVGLAEFRDKPFFPLGEATDFCYKRKEQGALSADTTNAAWALSILQPSGGGDDPEDHYQAIVNALLDPGMGWRPVVGSDDELSKRVRAEGVEEVAGRIIVVLSDATPHYNGQMGLYPPSSDHPDWQVPQDFPPNDGTIVDGDLNAACITRDYMDPQVFKQVVEKNNVKILMLHTADGDAIWSWVNEDLLGQSPKYRQIIDASSADFLQVTVAGIQAIADDICPFWETSTAEPETTTRPATTAEPETTTRPATTSLLTPTTTPLPTTLTTTPLPTAPATTPSLTTEASTATTVNCSGVEGGVLVRIKDKPSHMVFEIWNNVESSSPAA